MRGKVVRTFFVSAVLGLFCLPSIQGGEKGWSLVEIPPLDPPKEMPATAAEINQIKTLIRAFTAIDTADIGFSSTMAGDAFAPIPELDHWGGWTSAPESFKRSESLKKLVSFGPKTLPFLLEALADQTPTKLTLGLPNYRGDRRQGDRDGAIRLTALVAMQVPDGGMEPGREISCSPMNLRETRALKKAGIPLRIDTSIGSGTNSLPDHKSDYIKDYTYKVKVGDLCFVAIGQIVNRHYQAARYQGTGFVIINSPAHDAKLAKGVRNLWDRQDYRARLFDSLLIDFHTRGFDDRGSSERLQIGAAIRLLYYFPSEGAPLVAKRLRQLDVTGAAAVGAEAVFARNGIWADELLRALTFSERKEVRRELLEIFRRTTSPQCALAVLSAVHREHDAEALAKLKLLLKRLPSVEDRPEGDGYALLKAIGERFPNDSAEVFRSYVRDGNAQRRTTLCHVLREKWGAKLADSLLLPFLRDRDNAYKESYSVRPREYEPRLPLRICDEAAVTIALHNSAITFKLVGTHADLDRQIQEMLTKLK